MASRFGEEDSSADGCEIEVNFQLNPIISYSYEPTGIHEHSDHKKYVSSSTPTVDRAQRIANNTQ